ncbi:Uncharacterised protein [Mycobacteroides abscessus subsp. abscessus]|nr:Uncharacterised protein [Mycobacteroides abscessus subsp. abscessus]
MPGDVVVHRARGLATGRAGGRTAEHLAQLREDLAKVGGIESTRSEAEWVRTRRTGARRAASSVAPFTVGVVASSESKG